VILKLFVKFIIFVFSVLFFRLIYHSPLSFCSNSLYPFFRLHHSRDGNRSWRCLHK
jgi:hypothetical protein